MIVYIIAALCVGTCFGQQGALVDMAEYNKTQVRIFNMEDLNGDGVITKTEILQLFAKYDLNGNGKVSRHEYTESICQILPEIYPIAHYLYDSFDFNHDHTLDTPDYDVFFPMMDANGDGQVTFDEYYAYGKQSLDKVLTLGLHDLHAHTHSHCH